MSEQLNQVLTTLDDTSDAALARLFQLLRIESVSTDPAYKPSCQKAADWCAQPARATSASMPASCRPPAIRWSSPTTSTRAAGAPHVLFYGHYDVQPADP